MQEMIQSTTGQAVLWTTVLLLMAIGAYVLVLRFRDQAVSKENAASDLLSNFRELHEEGELNDAEFRTIKTMLGAKLQPGTKDPGESDPKKLG